MKLSIVSVLILAFALPVSAEPLKIPASLLIGVHAADLYTTSRALKSTPGAVEANPAMLGSDAKRIVLKSATAAGVIAVAGYLERHKRPKVARVFLYTVSAITLGVAIQNARVGR